MDFYLLSMTVLDHDNRHFLARFQQCVEVATDTFEATFKLEHPINYLAGQYIGLNLPELITPDPKGSRRAFSIINPPQTRQTTIQIFFRKSESGFKQTLLTLPAESPVTVIGPFGISFQFKKELQYPLILLSGGVAMAPFLCIMRMFAEHTTVEPIHFFNYDRDQHRIPYQSEIDLFNHNGNTASVSTILFQFSDLSHVQNLTRSFFFIGGPQEFVNHAYQVLTQNGISSSQLIFEENYPSLKTELFFKTFAKNNGKQKATKMMTKHEVFQTALEN